MKLVSVSLIILFSVTNNSCHKHFELIKASSQKWVGGREETGFGTYYELTIVPETNSDKLIFDKLWITDKYFEIQCFQKGKKMRNNLFGPGDTITIRINNITKPKPKPFVNKDNNTNKSLTKKHLLPKEYNGEALLSYTYEGKRKYYEIKHFTVSEPIYYP